MLSRIVKNITPSATCELEGTVANMRAEGIDVIGLNAGEPDFMTPETIRKACYAAMEAGKTKYVNIEGIIELRREICKKLERENQVRYEPDQICVSTGAKQAVNNAVMATVNPGDEVIIPIPCWVSYVEIVKLYGGIPKCVKTTEDYQLDLDAIEAAVTDKTAAILINSPNNPSGAVYTRQSLERLTELAAERGFYIISDEVYEKILYDDARHTCVASLSPEAYKHTIVVNGFSKAFSMTGWRIGYSAAPKEIADGICAIQGHTTSNSATFTQWASIAALQSCEEDVRQMVAEFKKRRDYAYNRLIRMPDVICKKPPGAFYLLPDVRAYYGRHFRDGPIRDSFDFCGYILNEARVAIVPGGAFHAENTVRIAYTNSMEKIVEGMDRIEAALRQLT